MLCLQCKLVEHSNHICSNLAPEAAAHRIKLRNDQEVLNEDIQRVDDLINECYKVALYLCFISQLYSISVELHLQIDMHEQSSVSFIYTI